MVMMVFTGNLNARESADSGYTVSVGEIAVTHHAANDFWSEPDLMVRVQRQDPLVLDRMYGLDIRIRELKMDERATSERLGHLQRKRKASEVVPGEPLSHAQAGRLAELRDGESMCAELRQSRACSGCSPYDERAPCPGCARCAELKHLTERKSASEVVPGEPLTEEEVRDLDALTQRVDELKDSVARARAERTRLLDSITGYTHSIETGRTTVDFNHDRQLLEIFPGDALEVAVLDDDVGRDDVYGKTVIVVTRDVLDGEQLELRMPNVRFVRLRFRPSVQDAARAE